MIVIHVLDDYIGGLDVDKMQKACRKLKPDSVILAAFNNKTESSVAGLTPDYPGILLPIIAKFKPYTTIRVEDPDIYENWENTPKRIRKLIRKSIKKHIPNLYYKIKTKC